MAAKHNALHHTVHAATPKNLSVVDTGANSVTLTWLPMQAKTVNYSIYCQPCYLIGNTTELQYSYSSYTNVTLTGLHPYTVYECCVSAVNASEGSCIIVITEEAGK